MLHAVPSEQAREALRSLERSLAESEYESSVRETGRGVLADEDSARPPRPARRRREVARDRPSPSRARAERGSARAAAAPREQRRQPTSVQDLELQFGDQLMEPRHRPRRVGAAADYARGERRTIEIRGQVAAPTMLRPTPSELRGPRPDRVAAWAFAFGIFMAVLALITG